MSLLAGCLAAVTLAVASGGAPSRTRILLIGTKHDHPPRTHMYVEVCGLLAKCLNQTPGVEAVVSDGWPAEPAALRDVKAIVLYSSPGGNILLDPAHREQAERLLARGVGYCAIHWATDAKPELGPEYQQILGGWHHSALFSRIKIDTAPMVQPDPAQPICRGWALPEWHEEFYLNLRFQPGIHPIVVAHVDGQDQVVAWAYNRLSSHGGRSFGTTLGHFYDNFRSEPFRRLLVNGILWSAHREVPPGGARCHLTEDDLRLPDDSVPGDSAW